jgi:hypothetical protein
MFCAPGLVFDGNEVVRFRFHDLSSRACFWRYRGRRVPFSCFARPDSFSAIPRASGPVFMFCAPVHVFESTAGIGSHFHVLLDQTRFQRYRGRRLSFTCFVLPDSDSAVSGASVPVFIFCAPNSFLTVPRASGPVFMFCAPRTRYRRCREPLVPFSCFARPNSFSSIPRAWGLVFMFCPP